MSEKRYIYHPMHMHLHAACDHGASMAMHMHNAQQLGMRYIWFTDHDTRTGEKQKQVHGYTFDTPALLRQESGSFFGFTPADEAILWQINPEEHRLRLRFCGGTDASWQGSGVVFGSSGTRHTAPLAANVTLSFDALDFIPTENTRLILDVTLSQRPPECVKAHLLYVLGSTDGLESPHTQVLPLSGSVFPLSEDVSWEPAIGGRDNAFDTVTLRLEARNGAIAEASFGDFRIHVEKHYEQAHAALKEAAAKAGRNFGITPFVSFEVSGSGCHKNCYGTQVPTIDYREWNYQVPVREAAAHIKSHGGIFAINHPFAIGELKRKEFTEPQRLRVLAKMQAELVANGAYGADLMEVGFPQGRNGFSLEEYLLLWDMLTVSGLLLTGYGSSDSHRDNTGWFSGNNFAAWIGVSETLTHPIPEQAFTEAMKKGRLYTGDPVKLRGAADFRTEEGYPMGTVLLSHKRESAELFFTAENTQSGWRFRLVENGMEVYSQELTGGSFIHRSRLSPGKISVNFQRAELWDETGRCILVTNPIYLINTRLFAGKLPLHRIPEEETT